MRRSQIGICRGYISEKKKNYLFSLTEEKPWLKKFVSENANFGNRIHEWEEKSTAQNYKKTRTFIFNIYRGLLSATGGHRLCSLIYLENRSGGGGGINGKTKQEKIRLEEG